MALLFTDSFDHYATADVALKYSQLVTGSNGNSTIGAFGRRSTNGWKSSISNWPGIATTPALVVAASGATFIMGMAFNPVVAFTVIGVGTAPDTDGQNTFIHCRYLGTSQVWSRINTNGTISVYRSTTLLGTTALALVQNVFQYVEMKVVLSTTVGTVDIRVDGASWLALTNQNTRNGSADLWDEFRLPRIGGNAFVTTNWQMDDVYVADGSGSGLTDFAGDSRVDALYPDANGTTRQWTPSTGADDYAVVDETSANTSDYLTGDVASDICTMGFPAASVSGATVHGVQVVAYSSKEDAGSCMQKAVTRIGGTNYFGAEKPVPSSYAFIRQVWDLKPSDSTDWTTGDFDAAEFGVQKSG